ESVELRPREQRCEMSGEASSQSAELPDGLIALRDQVASIEHKLGYFGDSHYVVFGYCAGGGEVIWKDGHSWGFGTGGWRIFLEEIAPLAMSHGIDLGSIGSAGTHVLLVDRRNHVVYAGRRELAEEFLCR